MFRIGFGYDAHRLVAGRPLILGGIDLPHRRGLQGHSDADVLTHAVIDAILGALGLGDIGRHFPPSDPQYKDMASFGLLQKVVEWMRQRRLRLNNLDCTIVAEEPELSTHLPAMREGLARVLGVGAERINLKATTTEGMGFCGAGEGMAAYAVVLLKSGGVHDPEAL